jgi:hypothetical protein
MSVYVHTDVGLKIIEPTKQVRQSVISTNLLLSAVISPSACRILEHIFPIVAGSQYISTSEGSINSKKVLKINIHMLQIEIRIECHEI